MEKVPVLPSKKFLITASHARLKDEPKATFTDVSFFSSPSQTDLMWEVYSIAVIETPCSMLRKFDFLRGDQKILTEFYNDGLLENILKHKLKTSAIDSILILQNYILYYGGAELCWIFF